MIIQSLVDFVLHLDDKVGLILQDYGYFTYIIMFLIIFLETGIVIAPFLPGDSLLFVLGTFAGAGFLNILMLFFLLALAAIIGDSVNYLIGNYFGENIFKKSKLFKEEYLVKTKEFYHKYGGGKTIFLARFIPIIRTFAPFVAGVGKMDYSRFLVFNIAGGISWVSLFLFGGYFFGGIPIIKENLTIVIIIIIVASIIPIFVECLRKRS